MRIRIVMFSCFVLLGCLMAAVGILHATDAAFTARTDNAGNTFGTGTVVLSDNGAGTAVFAVAALKPGASTTQCVDVQYGGSLPSAVRMYGSTSGDLAPYLLTTVSVGSTPSVNARGDCGGFVASGDASVDVGGAGRVFDGTLAQLPGGWSTGLRAESGNVTQAWTAGTRRVYQVTVRLDPAAPNSAMTASGDATFKWEARPAGVTSPTAYRAAVTADGPLALYRLGDTGSTTVSDAMGGPSGTYVGGALQGVPGATGDADAAVRLDGTDDHVALPSATWDLSAGVSVEAWVRWRRNPTDSSPRIVDLGNGPNTNNILLYRDNNAPKTLVLRTRSGITGTSTTAPKVATGRWMHVVGTVTATGVGTVYVDGQVAGTATGMLLPASTVRSVSYIGRSSYAGDSYANEDVDEVAIYGTALSAGQVAAHFAAGH